ncbi:MAG: LysR family transcriptional regulator [Pseudomonas sp.]|uniref:LysR family transcriptional regulator n=1 Tax=Pseudomonas abieticivorans TaxID=2931382 RepID=UPI0020C17085|nr:LysR family transcriptional regulator [Pseudomonas sp. PIA16]MDE1166134.1 LysR family transcriptional regulator [Pseudomonas sp.]
MKTNQFVALVAVAETGSIRAAAKSVGLTQAAITRTLRELELQQGVELLERTHTGVRFTDAGKSLLHHARLILSEIEKANADLALIRSGQVERLRIGLTPTINFAFLPECLSLFQAQYPNVQLEIYEGLHGISLPHLRDGYLDFAIIQASRFISENEFSIEPLLSYQSHVVGRKGHPQRDATSIDTLNSMRWLANFPAAWHINFIKELHRDFRVSPQPSHIVSIQSAGLLFPLLAQTDYLTVLPGVLLKAPSFASIVEPFSAFKSSTSRIFGIAARRGNVRSKAASAFIDILKQVIKQHARNAQSPYADALRPTDLFF